MRKATIAFLILIFFLIFSISFFVENGKGIEKITANVVSEETEPQVASFEQNGFVTEVAAPWDKKVYILQFKDPSMSGYSVQSEGYQNEVELQHRQAFADIGRILNGEGYTLQSEESSNPDFVLADYRYAFNGIAVNVSQTQLYIMENLPYVQAVFPSIEYHIDLNESVPLIEADKVWNLTDENGDNVTGKNITIAIIDTGVDYNHFDLGGGCFGSPSCKVIGGYDYVNSDADPMDDHGHGTHVAATAAGNGTLKGVAPGANIVAYKVCNSGGGCAGYYILQAIDNATANNYDIISMSIGGLGNPDDAMALGVDNAVNNGVVAVVAAGNSGPGDGTVESPGLSRKAITVGASYKNDNIAAFSSRGPTSLGTIKPDVLAPGVYICAAEWDSAWSDRRCIDSTHVSISGTSMATPHVAGLAALILQKHKTWNPAQVKMAIRNTAEDLGLELKDQGHGRVNAFNAVNLTSAPCIAEFYSYNASNEGAGVIKLNGTAQCSNFINYSVFYASEQGSRGGTVTRFNASASYVNFSFIDNQAKTAYFKIPKNSNVTFASLRINGSNNGRTVPYKVRVDFSGDGDSEWISYNLSISQEQEDSSVGYSYTLFDNNTIAQSFNWSGGEIAAISVLMQRRLSGNGLVVEIRNDSGGVPSEVLASANVSFGVISTNVDWNIFDFGGVDLPQGEYWFYIKLATTGFGDYSMPYSELSDSYPEGNMLASPDNGATWRFGYFDRSDLAFRIYKFGYFSGIDTINKTFASEINDFLKSCTPDSNGNCTFPIVINSTNGTLRLSNLNVVYGGIKSINATSWKLICSSGLQAENSELCSWDAALIGEQNYLLMLEVNGQHSTSSDYLFKKIKNFYMVRPENGYLVGEGTDIIINSTGNFMLSNYTIEYKNVSEDDSWHQIKFSRNQIGNGSLGYFNSSLLPEGVYIIRLTAYINNSNYSSQINATVRVDKKLHPGWPQELDFTVFASQKVADVDNDGNMEIIAASTRSPYIFQVGGDYWDLNRSVYIFRSNGTLMEGWPKPTSGNRMTGKTLTLGDLDNDGDLEILYPDYSGTRFIAMHHNGSEVSGWPEPWLNADMMVASPSLYDLDNDGNLEVIFAGQWYVWVYRANGSLMWKTDTSVTWGFSDVYLPVGDFNNDGYGEIFAYSNQFNKIYLFNYTGGVVEGWPYNVTPVDSGIWGVTIADLDNDSDMEIIFQQRGQGIVALHHNGSAVDGWPQQVEGNYVLDLIAADLNKDNRPEVIAFPFTYGDWNSSKIFVFNSDGTNFPGFPFKLPNHTLSMGPTVADIDGDSEMELVIPAQRITEVSPDVWWDGAVLYSFDVDTPGITSGFPMQMDVGPPYVAWERAQESSPVIADIDQDGKVEIVASSSYYTDRYPLGAYSGGRVVIWDMNTTYSPNLVEWGQFGNNIHNTMSYVGDDFDSIVYGDNCPYTYNPLQEDSDGDGMGDICDRLEGNVSSVNTTIMLNITIGGSANLSREFTNNRIVNFYDNNVLFINFTFNFKRAVLNLTPVSIEKGANGTNNYIIVRNLNITGTKTLYLERLNSSSNSVCFVDNSTESLTDLLSDCTLLNCPDTSGSHSCVLSNNTFVVSGFNHTALIETYDNCPYYYNPGQEDSDGDGVGDVCDRIDGNLSSINTTVGLNITINGSSNLSGDVNGSLPVSFYDNGSLFMNFTFNFTNATLDFTNVSIEKGANGTNNYIIITNLNITGTKTLFLQRANSSNNAVCFRDENEVLLSELVSNCTKLNCSGTAGNYSCVLSNNTFIVSGFRHSAVIESYSAPAYHPPSGGGGTGGGTGSGLVTVPSTVLVEGEVPEVPLPSEKIAVTEKVVTPAVKTEEAKPSAIEQPAQLPSVSVKKNMYMLPILIFAAVIIILAMLIYSKTRKKPVPVEMPATPASVYPEAPK